MKYSQKQFLSIILVAALVITGLPVFSLAGNWLTPVASAASPLKIEVADSGKFAISGNTQPNTAVHVKGTLKGSGETLSLGNPVSNDQGEWQVETALPANRIIYLTTQEAAVAGKTEAISVMAYTLPTYPITWEEAAAYFYKTDKVSSTKTQAKELAAWNGISGNSSSAISDIDSLLLIDPLTESQPALTDLPLFRTTAVAERLVVVNPSGQEPVDLARGDFVYNSPSLKAQVSASSLEFKLHYLSRNPEETVLGSGWRHSYDWSLQSVDGKPELLQPDGSRFEFLPLANGGFLSPRGTEFVLERVGMSGHVLSSPAGDKYRFDKQGQLLTITNGNGDVITFTYNDSKLNSVSAQGTSLQLQYNGEGKLASVSDQAGQALTLEYSKEGDLIRITDVDQKTTELTYDGAHHVLSVTIPGNTEAMSVVYDDKQRVVSLTGFDGAKKEIQYKGTAAPVIRGEYTEGGKLSIHPDNAKDIEESKEVLLSGTMHNLRNAPAYRYIDGLHPVITDYLADQSEEIRDAMKAYEASAVDHSSYSVKQLEAASKQSGSSKPAVLKGGQLNVEESVTFGSENNPVIVIVDGMNTNKEITVEVYGTLIFKNGLNANTKLNLLAHSVEGQYGNIWSGGRIHLNNDSKVEVQDTLYSEGLTYNNGLLSVFARRVVVNGELHINTRVKMDIADGMTLGGLVSNNELAQLTIAKGDLFVRDDVHVNNSLEIRTGGVFAIGRDMIPNRTPLILTGIGKGETLLEEGTGEVIFY